jgi:uncharacterized membrane protein YkgB
MLMHMLVRLLQAHRSQLLILSMGIIYLWFGFLKFIPGMSPAENLARETMTILTFQLIPGKLLLTSLAAWEVLIGMMFLFQFRLRLTIVMAMVHLLFTFAPLVLLPSSSFGSQSLQLTFTGQYIMKNLVFMSTLLFIYPESETKKEKKASLRHFGLTTENHPQASTL